MPTIRLIYGYKLNPVKMISFLSKYDFIEEKLNNILRIGYENLQNILKINLNFPHTVNLYTNVGKYINFDCESCHFNDNNVLGIEIEHFEFNNKFMEELDVKSFKMLSRYDNILNKILENYPVILDMLYPEPKIHIIYNF
jgi:hypothetical protein